MSKQYKNEWVKCRTGRRGVRKWVNWGIGAWVTHWKGECVVHVGYNRQPQGVLMNTPEEAMNALSSLPRLN